MMQVMQETCHRNIDFLSTTVSHLLRIGVPKQV